MTKDLISKDDVLPNGEDIKLYLRNIHWYYEHQELFSKEGFTFTRFEKVKRLAQLNTWDLYYLFYYSKRIPDKGIYLEIGSFLGGSLLCAYEATRASHRHKSVNFIAIEPAVTEQLLTNTKCIPHFRFIKCNSNIAKDQIEEGSIDLLFIDGNHSYEQCKRDIENYCPKVKKGGSLLGHDYRIEQPGVQKAVNEIFGQEGFIRLKNCTMWLVEKKERKND